MEDWSCGGSVGQLDVGEVAVDLFVCVCGSHIVSMNRASSWRLEKFKECCGWRMNGKHDS